MNDNELRELIDRAYRRCVCNREAEYCEICREEEEE